MSKTCCVCGLDSKNSTVAMHRFPKNEFYNQLWVQWCVENGVAKIDDVFKWAKICGQHFNKQVYRNNSKALKKTAIPTILGKIGTAIAIGDKKAKGPQSSAEHCQAYRQRKNVGKSVTQSASKSTALNIIPLSMTVASSEDAFDYHTTSHNMDQNETIQANPSLDFSVRRDQNVKQDSRKSPVTLVATQFFQATDLPTQKADPEIQFEEYIPYFVKVEDSLDHKTSAELDLQNEEEMTPIKRWREQDTIKFVKLYKAAECLWNSRHPGYRNRADRLEASNEIITAMNMPDFGHAELKNKIKNIRSTYAQELNKVKRASIGMEGGENYRTSLCWFSIADSFLKPLFSEEKRSGSANQTVSNHSFGDEDNYITLQNILSTASASGNNSPELYYPPLSVDADVIKTEILEDVDDEEEYQHQVKRAKIDDTNGQVHPEAQESNDSLSGEVRLQDEFFYFGKNVECQLRQMSLEKALECQFKILEVLAQYRIPT